MFQKVKQKYDIRADFGELTSLTVGRLLQELHRLLSQLRKCSGGRAMYRLLGKWGSESYKCELKYSSLERRLKVN